MLFEIQFRFDMFSIVAVEEVHNIYLLVKALFEMWSGHSLSGLGASYSHRTNCVDSDRLVVSKMIM